MTMVTEKNKKLSWKIEPKQTKPILCDPDVKSCLETLQKPFVVVTQAKLQTTLLAKNFTSLSSKQNLVFVTS